jgi:protein-L-isoaspartate(D-aspartate) O-methyltransferase
MIDFAEARRMMVDGQVRTYDVTDLGILAAMLEVPRERFVPTDQQAVAYLDRDTAVEEPKPPGLVRYLLKPAVLARLIQAANITDGDHVLDVGCASGYSAAVLSRLAGSVVALEEDAKLAGLAKATLADLAAANVRVRTGALSAGAADQAPFDAILLNGSTGVVPATLILQLKDGGRLVCVRGGPPMGKATLYRSVSGHVTGQPIFDAVAPPLPGFSKPAEFVF